MRKRNIAIMFRLNRKEAEALDKKVKKSGLNREAYLRQVITGIVPRDAPPPDYYSMMRELYKIGNNLNQIAQKAHVLKVMDPFFFRYLRNLRLQGSQMERRCMTGMQRRFMLTARLICFVRSMVLTHSILILVMRRSFLKTWNRRKSVRS